MAKQYTNLSKNYAQHIADFNVLVNKVGDLVNLNTSEDSDLVGAINAVLTEGGVDSAAIVKILDSGEYIAFADLTATADSDFVLVFGNQTVNGVKTFGSQLVARQGALFEGPAGFREVTRGDSSELFQIIQSETGTHFQWNDSTGTDSSGTNVMSFVNDTADSAVPGSVHFTLGSNNGTLVATIDSANEVSATTLMTRTKGDARYLLDDTGTVAATNLATNAVTAVKINSNAVTEAKINSGAVTEAKIGSNAVTTAKINNDAVTRAKLADEVSFIIYDSTGTPVKTLYGAGS